MNNNAIIRFSPSNAVKSEKSNYIKSTIKIS